MFLINKYLGFRNLVFEDVIIQKLLENIPVFFHPIFQLPYSPNIILKQHFVQLRGLVVNQIQRSTLLHDLALLNHIYPGVVMQIPIILRNRKEPRILQF